jgi:hypothetical protein
MPLLQRLIRKNIDWILVLVSCYFLFTCILSYIATDIQIHASSISEVNRGLSPYPPNFLYYFIVNLVSGFSESDHTLLKASVIVLAASVTFKYVLTRNIINSFFSPAQKRGWETRAIPVLSLILFAIPDVYNLFYLKQIYVSRIVPNVWHNSTVITLFPFAILLFWKQYRVLSGKEIPGIKNMFVLFLLMLVNVLIKPSFFFVYAPVTAIFLFSRFRLSKHFWLNIIPVVITIFVVYLLQQMIYEQNIASLYRQKSSVVLTTPFYIWSQVIPPWYIPVALIMSFILPTSYFILFGNVSFIDKNLWRYALSLMILALIISAVVAEQGPRALHLNFFWQNVICCYILDLVVVIDALSRYFSQSKPMKRMSIFSLVFFLHVLSGIFYFAVMFYRQHYR